MRVRRTSLVRSFFFLFATAILGACAEAVSSSAVDGPSDAGAGDGRSDAGSSTTRADASSTDAEVKDAGKDGPDAALDYCEALTSRAAACGEPPPKTCAANEACMDAVVHPASLQKLKACLAKRPCNASALACDEAEAQTHANEPSFVAYKAACNQAMSTCTDAAAALSYWCMPVMAEYAPAVLDDFRTCFGGACELVTDCLNAKNQAFGCE